MQFRVRSYRNGLQVLGSTGAFDEISSVLGGLAISDVERRRAIRQSKQVLKAGIQAGVNDAIKEGLAGPRLEWRHQVPIFAPSKRTKKGFWTMDFRKEFDSISVGVEVTFNHQEALPWTLIRPTLAHEDENVLPDAGIEVGAIIIGTDHFKGRGKELRMDSAVGTYERLVTLLPRMKSVLPAPLVIFGLDWRDGGQKGDVEEIPIRRRA